MPRPFAWIGLLAVAAVAQTAAAQVPRLEVAFAAGSSTSGLPAVAWLCGTVLPLRDEWPNDLDADASFVVRLSSAGLTIVKNDVALPEGALMAGSVEYEAGKRALCTCSFDGAEDWYIPRDAKLPLTWVRLLHLLRANDVQLTHTIDASVAAGHLLGALATGDPNGETVQLGAALCGEVTWRAWYNAEHLRVRGRSEGGLLLPATMLLLAQRLGNGIVSSLPLRAFASRDGDREEAVRQMSREETPADRAALLAMLYGSDELRLTAIDTLVRQQSTDDLPRIVEAAAPGLPLTTVAAADAVAAMWHDASEPTKTRTREALAASSTKVLRNFDPNRIPDRPSPMQTELVTNWRILGALFLLGICLFCFWLRERARALRYA